MLIHVNESPILPHKTRKSNIKKNSSNLNKPVSLTTERPHESTSNKTTQSHKRSKVSHKIESTVRFWLHMQQNKQNNSMFVNKGRNNESRNPSFHYVFRLTHTKRNNNNSSPKTQTDCRTALFEPNVPTIEISKAHFPQKTIEHKKQYLFHPSQDTPISQTALKQAPKWQKKISHTNHYKIWHFEKHNCSHRRNKSRKRIWPQDFWQISTLAAKRDHF